MAIIKNMCAGNNDVGVTTIDPTAMPTKRDTTLSLTISFLWAFRFSKNSRLLHVSR